MLSTDRADFIDNTPYDDSPQILGYNTTISASHMHALALEFLSKHLSTAKSCLDVFSGSGYLTLAFSKMMKEGSFSVGIEHIPELVDSSKKNIGKNHQKYLD